MAKLSDVLIFIRHHQDGEIAEKLRNSGLQYNMTYGVSSLLLANFVKKNGRNQQLADELWKEQFREAQLMAFMFSEPESLPQVTVEQYVDGCKNNEMVEIAVTHVFALLPSALEYAKKWIADERRYVKMSGYLTIARLAMLRKFGSENDLQDIFPMLECDAVSPDYFIFQSVVKAVQELAYRRDDLKLSISKKIKYICEQNKCADLALQVQELVQIIEYC